MEDCKDNKTKRRLNRRSNILASVFFNENHLTLTNVTWREIAKLQAEMSLLWLI